MTWYDVKAKAMSADIYIYDVIGDFGQTAMSLVNEIKSLKGKVLNVYINSPGGDVEDGIAVYNALSRHDGPVNVTVDGIAASVASVIAQAGGQRNMARGSAMMIHDAWGAAIGNSKTMQDAAAIFDQASDRVAEIYAYKAGGDAAEWRQRMKDETWYNAQQAVGVGLADAFDGPQGIAGVRAFNLSNYSQVPEWVPQQPTTTTASTNVNVNSITWSDTSGNTFTQSTQAGQPDSTEGDDMSLEEVRQALGLTEDGDPIAAINALKGEVTSLKATINSDSPDKGEAAQLRAELQAANKAILDADAEKNRTILDLRERLASQQAENRVEKAIGQGKITPVNRDYALKVARDLDEDGWNKFVRTLPSVNLKEIGSAADGADVEPTQEEASIARQMGINPEELVKQKVRDLS